MSIVTIVFQAAIVAVAVVLAWRRSFWRLPARIVASAYSLSLLAFALFVWNYRLLGWIQ